MRRLRDIFRRKNLSTDTSLGALLVNLGFITRVQLRDALQVRHAATAEEMLGEVLIARGYITRNQMDRVLLLQREQRGERVDYAEEACKLVASASERAEKLHAELDDVRTRVLRIANVDGRFGYVGTPVPRGEKS